MPSSALDFLTRHLLDRQAGGCFAATDVSGETVLSTDKQLTDQSSAVLALAEAGTDDDLAVALAGLGEMQDRHGHPGFVEFTGRYWQAYPAGRVRSLRYQLHAAAALLAAAHRLDDDPLRARAVDLVNRCVGAARDGRFPAQLTEDWRGTLDARESPLTAVSAVRTLAVAAAVGESAVDTAGLPAIARRLAALTEEASWPSPAAGLTRCSSLARVAISLVHAGRLLDADDFIKAADSVLSLAAHFHDPADGGFWDRLDSSGAARVDWVDAPRAGRIPFPVKRAADAAQLLLAARLLNSCQVDTGELIATASATIEGLTDHRHGGVFLGIGYRWPGPDEPGARTVTQLWTHPAQPGLTQGGMLGHLGLQQKSAHTQATVARCAAPGERPYRQEHAVRPVALRPPAVTLAVDHGVALGLDRDAAARTLLGGAAAHGGDRRWVVSAAYHLLAQLRVLAAEPAVPPGLIEQILLARNADGGFGEQAGQLSDIATTCRAVVAVRLAGRELPRVQATVDYLRGCQHPDGGFGAVPGMSADIVQTALALAALRVLGGGPIRPDAAAGWVLSCARPDGSFGFDPDQSSSTVAVRNAVAAMTLLGAGLPDSDSTVGWLLTRRRPTGGFTHRPGADTSIHGTYHAIAALAMLGAVEDRGAATERWLTARRHLDGRSGPPGAGGDGFACLQTVAILRGAVGPAWPSVVG